MVWAPWSGTNINVCFYLYRVISSLYLFCFSVAQFAVQFTQSMCCVWESLGFVKCMQAVCFRWGKNKSNTYATVNVDVCELLIVPFPENYCFCIFKILMYFTVYDGTCPFVFCIHTQSDVFLHTLETSNKTTANSWLNSQVHFVSSLIMHTDLSQTAAETNALQLAVWWGTNISVCSKYDSTNLKKKSHSAEHQTN